MSAPTITAPFGRAIHSAATGLGVRLAPWDHFQGPRLSLRALDVLWTDIDARSRDPLIGARIGSALQATHLDSAGLLLMSCGTMHDAVQAFVRYFPIISESCAVRAEPADDGLQLVYTPGYVLAQPLRAEAVLCGVAALTASITGGAVRVTLDFAHPPRTDPALYHGVLGDACAVRFDRPSYAVFVSARDLAAPLVQANPSLQTHLRAAADDALLALHHEQVDAQVQRFVRRQPRWNRADIAAAMAISDRQLGRRLAATGTSFRTIRDAVHCDTACALLEQGTSIGAITAHLGYSDESAFGKAFRRWTGQSPGRFRVDVLDL